MAIEINSNMTFQHAEPVRGPGGSTVGLVPWHNVAAKAPAREFKDGHDLAAALGMDWRADPGPLARPGSVGHTREGFAPPPAIPFRGVFRSDNGVCIGAVGKQWHAIQNAQLCDLAVSLSRIMPITISAGGILGEGEQVWVMADLGTRQIGDRVLKSGQPDAINQYVLFSTAHNGKGAAKVIPVPNQCNCANALAGIIKSQGKFGWSISHTLNATVRLEKAKAGLFRATRWFDQLFQELEELERQPFTPDLMRTFAEQLIAETRGVIGEAQATLSDRAKASQQEDVDTLVRLYDEGASNIGRTKADALASVTEFISHHRRRAQRGGNQTRAALARLEDEWQGSHTISMRRRALNILQNRN
jgi:phage/plasmid-like protein (TIGR03299 family)